MAQKREYDQVMRIRGEVVRDAKRIVQAHTARYVGRLGGAYSASAGYTSYWVYTLKVRTTPWARSYQYVDVTEHGEGGEHLAGEWLDITANEFYPDTYESKNGETRAIIRLTAKTVKRIEALDTEEVA